MDAYHASYHPNRPPTSIQNKPGLTRLANAVDRAILWRDTCINGPELRTQLGTADLHGIYHWPVESGSKGLRRAIDSAIRVLGIRKWQTRRDLQRGLQEMLAPFYLPETAGYSMVILETCRELFASRCEDFATQGAIIRQIPCQNVQIDERSATPWLTTPSRPISLLNTFLVNPRWLPLALPEGYRNKECYFRGTNHLRIAVSGKRGRTLGTWHVWYLAHPWDHADILKNGNYATRITRLLPGGINPGRLMTWMKFDTKFRIVASLCLDFDTFTEQILTIRYVEMRVEDYIHMDPRLDRWLNEAIYHATWTPRSDDEVRQKDEPGPY